MPRTLRTARQRGWTAPTLLAILCAVQPIAGTADWRATLDGGITLGDSGNAQRLRGALTEPTRPLTRSLAAEAVRDPDRGDTLLLDGSLRYWLTRGAYGFIDARALRDEPLGIDRQLRAIAGPGYRWQRTPPGGLGIEAGAGVVLTRLDGPTDGDEDSEGIGVLRADGFRNVLDRLRLGARLELARTERLAELRGEISVALNLGGGSVSYTLQGRRVDPDGGTTRDETLGFVSLGYRF